MRAPRPRSPAGHACTQRRSRAAGIARVSITRSIARRSAARCPKHLFVPDLVPGEVTDAGDDHVVYRMADGAWINDAREAVPC